MLYTTKQIAKMYSGEEKNITPYMVVNTWVKQGLKHIRGKGKEYLYKKEWVEEFLEEKAVTFQENNEKIKYRKTQTISSKKLYVV